MQPRNASLPAFDSQRDLSPSSPRGSRSGEGERLAGQGFTDVQLESHREQARVVARIGTCGRKSSLQKSEAVLSFNDDFFLLRPHATTDFYSSLYGTVIRFDEGVSSASWDKTIADISSTSRSAQSWIPVISTMPAK